MDLFVSYHSEDRHVVERMVEILPDYVRMSYWDGSNIPGDYDWESIDDWLETADVVVVLVTSKTLTRAISVGQEIGRARALDKHIIPVVARDVSPARLGALKGITAVRFDEESPDDGLLELANCLNMYRRELWNKRLLVGGLAAAGLAWLGRKRKPPQQERPPYW